uniref:Steroid receptor associated and regulated protein n=1 Tax=Rhinolophus ferrumequinum TaxID=59479 RepID=A0A671E8A0_RHIFE
MAPSEDPRVQRASPITGREARLETSLGGKPAHPQTAIPTAHLTFVIDCAQGKQLSLTPLPVLPRAPSSNLGPVTPPVKTHILFCGESQPLLGGGHLAQARSTLPSCRGAVAPPPLQVDTLCSQEAPQAKGSPLKTACEISSLGDSQRLTQSPLLLSGGRQINWKSLPMGRGD